MITDEELNRELIVLQANAAALNCSLMKLILELENGKEQEDESDVTD